MLPAGCGRPPPPRGAEAHRRRDELPDRRAEGADPRQRAEPAVDPRERLGRADWAVDFQGRPHVRRARGGGGDGADVHVEPDPLGARLLKALRCCLPAPPVCRHLCHLLHHMLRCACGVPAYAAQMRPTLTSSCLLSHITAQLSVKPSSTTASSSGGADDHPVRVFPTLHVEDLPMLAGLSVSAFRSPLPVVLLSGPDAGDTMLRAAALQDKNVAFQAFVHRLTSSSLSSSAQQQGAPLTVVASSAASHRFDVVMLVHEGPLGATAKTHGAAFRLLAQLLRAGEDTMHLVYFAQNVGELARAQKVLEGLTPDADNPMLEVTRKVLVPTDSISLALDHFADSVGAQLVVVAAGTAVGGAAVLGSVAMTVARRTTFPLLIAKPDLEGRVVAAGDRLKALQDEEAGGRPRGGMRGGARGEAPGLRVLLGVEVRSKSSGVFPPRLFAVSHHHMHPPPHALQRLQALFAPRADGSCSPLPPHRTRNARVCADGVDRDGPHRLLRDAPAAEARHAHPGPLREPRRGEVRDGAGRGRHDAPDQSDRDHREAAVGEPEAREARAGRERPAGDRRGGEARRLRPDGDAGAAGRGAARLGDDGRCGQGEGRRAHLPPQPVPQGAGVLSDRASPPALTGGLAAGWGMWAPPGVRGSRLLWPKRISTPPDRNAAAAARAC